jgi:hypothetical protein
MLGQQGHVKLALGGEVLIEELLCDPCRRGDVLEPRLGVAALGEQRGRGILDHGSPLGFLQPPPGLRFGHKLTKSTLSC